MKSDPSYPSASSFKNSNDDDDVDVDDNNKGRQRQSSSMPDRDFNYTPSDASERAVAKGGVACPFPWRVHEVLKVAREENLEHVISWAPHGKAFTVHKPAEFVDKLMTRFFCQTKFASFQRQLNLYGFSRFCHGRDKGAYYHPCFLRGQRHLVRHMIRRKIKGNANQLRRPMPQEEPDFYVESCDTTGHNSTTISPHTLFIPCVKDRSYGKQQQQQQQHAVSPVPYSGNTEDETCHLERLFQREVSEYHESYHNDDMTLFEELPLHFFEESHQPTTLIGIDTERNANPTTATATDAATMNTTNTTTNTTTTKTHPLSPPVMDPTSELVKIRAQIRQKQEEYERKVGQPAPAPIRRVSLMGPPCHNIPLYKGSYISV